MANLAEPAVETSSVARTWAYHQVDTGDTGVAGVAVAVAVAVGASAAVGAGFAETDTGGAGYYGSDAAGCHCHWG